MPRKINAKSYRKCAVPLCKNSTTKNPDKLFMHVPLSEDLRKKWLQLARRELSSVSPKSAIFFCEDHFDLPKDMENYMQYKIMGRISTIRMKPSCLPSRFVCQPDRLKTAAKDSRSVAVRRQHATLIQEILEQTTKTVNTPSSSNIESQINIRTGDETEADLSKPAKVKKKPGGIRVFELGLCKECGQHIKRFQWWCLQCSGARCYQCARRMAHHTHLLMRTAAGGTDEKTRTVIENIRQHLQIETVQVKMEIEDEETGKDQAENVDRLNVEVPLELEIKVEPTSSEFDPLSVKPDPDAPYFEVNPRKDVMDMDDIDGHFEAQNQRSRSQLPSHNEQNFTVTTDQNNDHDNIDNTIRIHSIYSQYYINTVKKKNMPNRKQQSKTKVLSQSELNDRKRVSVKPKKDKKVLRHSEESGQNIDSPKQKNDDSRIQQLNIQVSSYSEKDQNTSSAKEQNYLQANIQEIIHSLKHTVESNQGSETHNIQVYSSHRELEIDSDKQNETQRSNSEHQNTISIIKKE